MDLGLTLKDLIYLLVIGASIATTFVSSRAGMKHYVRDRVDELNKTIQRLSTDLEVQKNKMVILEQIYGSVNELIQENLRNLKKGGEGND